MKLEIVTPEGEYFNAEVETVELPGTDGHREQHPRNLVGAVSVGHHLALFRLQK